MAIRKYLRRRRGRSAEGNASPHFFKAEQGSAEVSEPGTFFPPAAEKVQASLKVSQPGDPQEVEADRMADRVVQKKEEAKGPAEEEPLSRAPKEAEALRKPEEEVQKAGTEKEREQVAPVRTPASVPAAPVSAAALRKPRTGQTLPPGVVHEMSARFGYDFSPVRIHTGRESEALNEQLQSRAFAFGKNIFFNRGQYNPATESGRWLLGHELTHVVQQKGSELEQVQRDKIPSISTPVPKELKLVKKKEQVLYASGTINGVQVILRPDNRGPLPAGRSGETALSLKYQLPPMTHKNGVVVSVTGAPVVTFTIRTTYLPKADTALPSAYGKGTTPADKAAGNTSLEFHEGSHGTEAMDYLRQHPLPGFDGKAGMSLEDYGKAKALFTQQMDSYYASLQQANIRQVDCTGNPASFCKP
ncbi:MAG TPA: DUF4157 domain-containing protein [Chitinophagaceae bacterium]|jgi:hypothetical protein|nr:DUF4157 domain-containing protein [Chitinophagaceae bacterium]